MLLILNPVAGQGKAGERQGEIRRLMSAKGLAFDLRLTERVGHAAEIAASAGGEGYGVVIAAGGDGTVNEVVNGLMIARAAGGPLPALAVLSVGRGNDFSYGADLPGDLEGCVEVLAAGARRPLDVGFVKGGDYPEGKYFANGMGVGFDTIVGLEAAKMKRVHGFMAYVLGALKTFVMFPDAPLVRLEYDGEVIEQRSQQISVMNGKRMGGTFFMAPDAENHDGRFELCVAERLNRREMVDLMVRYTKGTQAGHSKIKTMSASRLSIRAPEGGLIVHADGETVCVDGTELDVACVPNALSIVCDPGRVDRERARKRQADDQG
ncbi:MAG: diacylglycerol kinase family lipid kinase [Spirochaetes bacterium]|nr:diacylglycerol kinase family lipid kinase [Spirochaetota bacterium]MBU1081653.1 diacylglycerol kinase family lipid kinase [Spirochaetota bacterium]